MKRWRSLSGEERHVEKFQSSGACLFVLHIPPGPWPGGSASRTRATKLHRSWFAPLVRCPGSRCNRLLPHSLPYDESLSPYRIPLPLAKKRCDPCSMPRELARSCIWNRACTGYSVLRVESRPRCCGDGGQKKRSVLNFPTSGKWRPATPAPLRCHQRPTHRGTQGQSDGPSLK